MNRVELESLINSAKAATGAPLEQALSLPSAFYTDPAIFDAERVALFEAGWLFICREDQVATTGNYFAADTALGPVLITHGEDGTIRAFANVCRHRGSLLLEGRGKCRRIVCPYHAWSYRLDGTLAGAPEMETAPGFEASENGLIPIRMENWAGFLFVTRDDAAPPLVEWLGDMPARLASHKLDEMRHVWSITLDCACNWKLLLENAIEAYHTGLVHRDTVGAQASRGIETEGNWVCLQVLSDRSIATLPDQAPGFAPIEGLDEDAAAGTYFTVALPTCQFAVAQDCLWWLNVTPLAADRSRLEIGGCFPDAATKRPDFEALAHPYLERWEAVGREDVGILEKQQRALASPFHRPGRLGPREEQVRQFDLWVLNTLSRGLTDQRAASSAPA